MDIYFVRHGQTDGNVALRHQHVNTSLNELGKLQARMVARKIAKIKPTNVVSSTNLRAIETTKIIVDECGRIPPETHPAFEELRRPDWLTGRRFVALETVWYVVRWFFGLKIKGDGESYEEFLARVIEARTLLESLPENSRVVVVSHAVFINLFLEHLCMDKRMSFWRACKRLVKVLTLRNASIIHLRYEAGKGKCGWRILTRG